ncbi:hypothetical protein HDU91_003515 [Kappamyces sp. JEL0680]|nr:hypothetical protein HDU91_003515 [Kappamyces sp. JEL0680]
MNIKENLQQMQKDMARIKNATGVEFKFEVRGDVNWLNDKVDDQYKNRLGEIFMGDGGFLQAVAELIENGCKDAMVKVKI